MLNPRYPDLGRNSYFCKLLEAAAPAFGYRVVPYEWSSYEGFGSSPKQLERIWDARGVKGLLIGPQTTPVPPALQWDKYACIAIGDSLQSPELHRVDSDFRQATLDCCLKLHQKGYKRIGLIALWGYDRAMRFSIRGGYEAFHYQVRNATRLEIMGEDLNDQQDHYEQDLRRWISEHSPDVIISDLGMYHTLRSFGFSFPRDMAFASWLLDSRENQPDVSGILRAESVLANTCVELLLSQIHHGFRGVPSAPIQTKIEGTWTEGRTTP